MAVRGLLAAPAAIAIGATALIGCTGGQDERNSSQTTTNGEIPEFSWALRGEVASLDFAQYPNISLVGAVMSLVTEPLERVSATTSFKPGVAEGRQPDPTTLVYTIRPGLKFSDGRALTVADIAWSIRHYTAKTAGTSGQMPKVKSVTVTDENTVRVRLATGDPVARAKLASVYVSQQRVAERHPKEFGTASALPIGTGPYRVAKYDPQEIVLEPNSRYAGERPLVEKLKLPIIKDDNAFKLAIRSKSVDGGKIQDLKSIDEWRNSSGASVYTAQSTSQHFLRFDVTQTPFDDVHVRRAIAYATNKAGIAKVAFNGNVSTLEGMVPAFELSGVAGGTLAANDYLSGLPQYEFDLDKAKMEMAKSAHPDGFSTSIEYIGQSTWAKQTALVLQRDLKALGIKLTAKSLTSQEWFSKVSSGKLQGFGIEGGYTAPVNDPSALLSSFVGKNGQYNVSRWTTPSIERASAIVDSPGSDEKRWAATRTILSGIATEVPYIPLFNEPTTQVFREGFTLTGKDGIDAFEETNGDWLHRVRATRD